MLHLINISIKLKAPPSTVQPHTALLLHLNWVNAFSVLGGKRHFYFSRFVLYKIKTLSKQLHCINVSLRPYECHADILKEINLLNGIHKYGLKT